MNVVLTSYFNKVKDPQRDVYWEADNDALKPLIKSVTSPLVVFTDCLEHKNTRRVKYIQCEVDSNPYFYRWAAYLKYLKQNDAIKKVFCVDATDVQMLRNPFKHMLARIYVGDESQDVNCDWMLESHPEPFLQDYFRGKHSRLLNVGLLGGRRKDIIRLLEIFVDYSNRYKNLGKTEMGAFNYILYNCYKGKITNGELVNTKFKALDYDNEISWWRHK